jgi:uncharacterized protein
VSQSLELIKKLYAAFAAGDVPTFLGHLHPQVRWNEAESNPLADRNPYVGPDAIVSGVFLRLGDDWEDFQVVVGEIVGGGNLVTMLGRYHAVSKASGKPLDIQVQHTWWIEDGKVVRFQQMADTARMLRTMA